MTQTPPFMSSFMEVKPEWIDHNGHLNMAYYNVLFDHGVDEAYVHLGFGPNYIKDYKHTTFTADFRVRYLRELHVGNKVRVAFQLLDSSDRAFHFAQWLYHEDGWLSATAEGVGLHIDMSGPRVAPYLPHVAEKMQAVLDMHKTLPRPDFVGLPMGLRSK